MPEDNERDAHCPGAVILLALVLIVVFVSKLAAYDLWWHLNAGRLILRTMSVPTEDIFSFTAAGQPWVYHSWLGGVVLHLVHACAGLPGLVLLRSAVISLALVLSWVAARRRGVVVGLGAVLVLACAFQLSERALTRPYIFSFVLFVLFYLILQGTCRTPGIREPEETGHRWGDRGRLMLLPLLMLLWVNVHGGFVVGILLIGAFGAGEMMGVLAGHRSRGYRRELVFGPAGARFRALLVTGVFTLAATIFNPYGGAVLTYPIRLFGEVEVLSRVNEWKPLPWSMDYGPFWVLLGLVGLCLLRTVVLAARQGRLRDHAGGIVTDLLLMGGFALMALRSVRNVAWFLLLIPPVLGYHFQFARRLLGLARDHRRRTFYGVLAVLLGLLALGWHLGGERFGIGLSRRNLPVDATRYLESHPVPGPTYNVYEWGGYLIWRRWPEARVFVDGRTLLYGDRIIGQAMRVAEGGEGWREILDHHGIRSMLIRHEKRDSTHFFEEGKWQCIYWDALALVAVRAGEAPELERRTLTNPVTFEERFERVDPRRVLEELDRVLDAGPENWRAWTFRSRALLRVAGERREDSPRLRQQAVSAARRAAHLRDDAPEAWRVLSKALRAADDREGAHRAARRAAELETTEE